MAVTLTPQSLMLSPDSAIMISISGIKSVDGDTMEPLSWYFTTMFRRLYTTPSQVRLEIYSYIENVPDQVIIQTIAKWSNIVASFSPCVDQICTMFDNSDTASAYYKGAVRGWTKNNTAIDLLRQVIGFTGGTRHKRLGDLDVTYGNTTQAIQAKIDDLVATNKKLEPVILSCGALGMGQGITMATVSKGAERRDTPLPARSWTNFDQYGMFADKVPAVNTVFPNAGGTRGQRGYNHAATMMPNDGLFAKGKFVSSRGLYGRSRPYMPAGSSLTAGGGFVDGYWRYRF